MINLVYRISSFLNYKKEVVRACIELMMSTTYLGYSNVRYEMSLYLQGEEWGYVMMLRVNSQKAKSTPSKDVPDIIPITFIEVSALMEDFRIFPEQDNNSTQRYKKINRKQLYPKI